MQLKFRPGVVEDFESFYRNCFYRHQNHAELRAAVEREWRILTPRPATLTMIVEDLHRPDSDRIVGCGQVVFVTDAYVKWVREGRRPWVNTQVILPLPTDGSEALLDSQAIQRLNGQGGLNALITRWNSAQPPLSPEEGSQVREYMSRAFNLFDRGFQFKEILAEVVGEAARESALHTGFRLVADYADYYGQNPPPPDIRPFLMGLTREEALQREGSLISQMFVYTPPLFGFTRGEQELLFHALRGEKDREAAILLGVGVAEVRRRWANIYQRVMEADPQLLPEAANDTRGQEKRRTLLGYLSNHPEELRPHHKQIRLNRVQ